MVKWSTAAYLYTCISTLCAHDPPRVSTIVLPDMKRFATHGCWLLLDPHGKRSVYCGILLEFHIVCSIKCNGCPRPFHGLFVGVYRIICGKYEAQSHTALGPFDRGGGYSFRVHTFSISGDSSCQCNSHIRAFFISQLNIRSTTWRYCVPKVTDATSSLVCSADKGPFESHLGLQLGSIPPPGLERTVPRCR